MKLLTRVTVVLALLAVPTIALAAIPTHAVLAPNCDKAQYKPRQLILACNDGSDYLTQLHWKRWTRRAAHGTGIDKVNDCKPDCARGHFHAYPVSVSLSRPRRCAKVKHHLAFGHIGLEFPKAHPGRTSSESARLFCPF